MQLILGFLLLCCFFGVGLVQAAKSNFTVFCHWNVQSQNRRYHSNFKSYHLDLKLCPQIIFGSALRLNPAGTGDVLLNMPTQDPEYAFLTETRRSDSKMKALVSIGGGSRKDNKLISQMMADVEKRDRFYASLINILYRFTFQGINLEWEFPAHGDCQPEDKRNFNTFLNELRIILREHNFGMMVTVSARLDQATQQAYDIPKILDYADFVGLRIHNPRDPLSGRLRYNAPLRGDQLRSVESCVSHWVEQGKQPKKLLLIVPIFGQTYTMSSPNSTADMSSKGAGKPHAYSQLPGYMTFGEFCVDAVHWQKQFDKEAQVPYAYQNDQWISYENGRSISAKMHLVEQYQLGGAIAMSVDADDFRGECGENNGLLRVMISILGDPKVLQPEEPLTEPNGMCPQEGLFRHMWECRQYYECRDGKRTDYECISGYYFDHHSGACKPAQQVECNQDFVIWRPGMKLYNFKNLPLNLKIEE